MPDDINLTNSWMFKFRGFLAMQHKKRIMFFFPIFTVAFLIFLLVPVEGGGGSKPTWHSLTLT